MNIKEEFFAGNIQTPKQELEIKFIEMIAFVLKRSYEDKPLSDNEQRLLDYYKTSCVI